MKSKYHKLPAGFRSAVDPIVSSRSRHQVAWWIYSTGVRLVSIIRGRTLELDSQFVSLGFKQGLLPEADVAAFRESLELTTTKALVEEDFSRGYAANLSIKHYEGRLNEGHVFFALGRQQIDLLTPLLQKLQPSVARCIGSPWRVANVRCWKTIPQAAGIGPNAWHTDGFPSKILKIMIYLTPTDPMGGTTELLLKDGSAFSVTGRAGSWLLFENSGLQHRGVAPRGGERFVLEVTITPSFQPDQFPVCAGLNASYPKFPWARVRR